MKSLGLALPLIAAFALPTFAAHHCAADARDRAEKLLTFHFNDGTMDKVEQMSIDDNVTVLAPLNRPNGKGKLDVLEVAGFIYKGNYRLRMIYAQDKGSCTLVGQEVIENGP